MVCGSRVDTLCVPPQLGDHLTANPYLNVPLAGEGVQLDERGKDGRHGSAHRGRTQPDCTAQVFVTELRRATTTSGSYQPASRVTVSRQI